jgi:hypothetical protein
MYIAIGLAPTLIALELVWRMGRGVENQYWTSSDSKPDWEWIRRLY